MDGKWEKIYNVGNPVEASIVQDILRNEGIESKIVYGQAAQYVHIYTGNVMGTEGIYIFVEKENAERAIEIIHAYMVETEEENK